MLTAFTGYSIANGNMSYWGISVILGIAKPIDSLYTGMLSGYSIGSYTLTKLFTIHFVLPLVALVISVGHMALLHSKGSSCAVTSHSLQVNSLRLEFTPLLLLKDL